MLGDVEMTVDPTALYRMIIPLCFSMPMTARYSVRGKMQRKHGDLAVGVQQLPLHLRPYGPIREYASGLLQARHTCGLFCLCTCDPCRS